LDKTSCKVFAASETVYLNTSSHNVWCLLVSKQNKSLVYGDRCRVLEL